MKTNPVLDLTNPIAAAVMPLKSEAVLRAQKEATKAIVGIKTDIAAAGYDLNIAAPYPKSFNYAGTKAQYKQAVAKFHLYQRLTRSTNQYRSMKDPNIVTISDESCSKFVENAGVDAALEYDAFIYKLTHKIGEVEYASLSGNHVWGYSLLTVKLTDGTVQDWKTQMIINFSKYDKMFNQFPSRKIGKR